MTIPDFYDYLARARRDLWASLEQAPDEALSRAVIPGKRFHSIKDLVLHIAAVEDSWLHEDILRDTPVWEGVADLKEAVDGPYYAHMPLRTLLDYWRLVEQSTLGYLAHLTPEALAREVVVQDSGERFTAESLLWHVMQHEVRHSAQIVLLLRQLGITPPWLDLLNYLPLEEKSDTRVSRSTP